MRPLLRRQGESEREFRRTRSDVLRDGRGGRFVRIVLLALRRLGLKGKERRVDLGGLALVDESEEEGGDVRWEERLLP